jgi:hypothetical protein
MTLGVSVGRNHSGPLICVHDIGLCSCRYQQWLFSENPWVALHVGKWQKRIAPSKRFLAQDLPTVFFNLSCRWNLSSKYPLEEVES